ncbi:hypothetical protein AB0I28_14185 [Phytomonospora sp. NPDC050363]|uniref:hypothetical protein n=1 Tax=Phytomonospora sp. NPDC050363 TaxID=3155642 RepID=UPI0033D4142D
MFLAKLRQRRAEARAVSFCDSCAQVCTSECRAQARLERVHAKVAYEVGYLR